MIITFCGHSNLVDNREKLREKLLNVLLEQIPKNKCVSFYLGGYGAFDSLALDVCLEYKKNFNNNATLCFLTPYLIFKKEDEKDYKIRGYDEIIYPDLETVPKRLCILRRNDSMVKQADLIIAYINHTWGGAYEAFKKAKQMNKHIINLGQTKK